MMTAATLPACRSSIRSRISARFHGATTMFSDAFADWPAEPGATRGCVDRTHLFERGMVTVESRIHPAVIVAFKLENQRPSRKSPRQPVRQLYSLAAAGRERHAPGAWDHRLDALGDGDFKLVLRAETVRLLRTGAHGFDHFRMAVSQDVRSPRELVIDILVAIHID